MARSQSFVATVLVGCLSTSCGEHSSTAKPAGEVEWHSEHFVYNARADDTSVCPEVLDTLEQHFATMQKVIGFAWPEGRKIYYHKYFDVAEYQAASVCPADAGACEGNANVWTFDAMQTHELIHAYLEPLGHPPTIFIEGVAETLGCEDAFYELVPHLNWDDPDNGRAHYIGKALVSRLLEAYGWEPFMNLYRGPWQTGDRAEIQQRFEEIYGVPIDDFWESVISSDDQTMHCVLAWECTNNPFDIEQSLMLNSDACGQTDDRSFTVKQETQFEFHATNNTYLFECPQDLALPFPPVPELYVGNGSLATGVSSSIWGDLPEGRYFLSGQDGQFTATREELLIGVDCTALSPAELETSTLTNWIFKPRSTPYFIRLRGSSNALSVYVKGASAQACPSCTESADCIPLNDDDLAVMLDNSQDTILHFPAGDPDNWAQLFISPE